LIPSQRSILFRFRLDKRESCEGTATKVTKKLVAAGKDRKGKEKSTAEQQAFPFLPNPPPLFLNFCSRPMRSRDFVGSRFLPLRGNGKDCYAG